MNKFLSAVADAVQRVEWCVQGRWGHLEKRGSEEAAVKLKSPPCDSRGV